MPVCENHVDTREAISEINEKLNRIKDTIYGNGTEGLVVRVRTTEHDLENLCKNMDKIQQTMTYISRTAWGIICLVIVNAIYWATRILVSHGG